MHKYFQIPEEEVLPPEIKKQIFLGELVWSYYATGIHYYKKIKK
jgi:hypothetical protein